VRKEFFIEFDECTKEGEEQTNNNMWNLLRQFKNIGNYLRLLFDPDVYGLCKLYTVIECLLVASSCTSLSS